MNEFPRAGLVRQRFERPRVGAVREILDSGIFRILRGSDLSGRRIAVAVGSRGIDRLSDVVLGTCDLLREQQAAPFIVPAMGSHGGATAEGQALVLRNYGVHQEALGVPVISSLETMRIGTTPSGVPVQIDRTALEADGIVLINRVKPHTDFHGKVESGLLKMIAVGLGNEEGARDFHTAVASRSHDEVILQKSETLLSTGKVLFGVAILENAYHELAEVEVVSADSLSVREPELLERARSLMPSLPADPIDLLIVDRIGKNISGTGMDPNITGRHFRGSAVWQEEPWVSRIVVLDLTAESEGNAIGLGLADFCSARAAEKMDRQVTYRNVVTSQNSAAGRIPMVLPTDRQLLREAVRSLGSRSGETVRMIRIVDTLSLETIQISEALVGDLRTAEQVEFIGPMAEIFFDASGNLGSLNSAG